MDLVTAMVSPSARDVVARDRVSREPETSMATTTLNPAGARARSSLLVPLLALAIFIHALDRGNFGTAAPLIKDDLQLSNSQIGVLLSAFFWSYVPGHLIAGWLIGRINAYRTLALGLALWSAATLLTGLAGGFATLFALRLLLGVGESAGFPASSELLAEHLAEDKRGTANALVSAGLMLGNGAGVLLGGLLVARVGWHALFFLFGGLSLLWLLPWRSVSARHRVATSRAASRLPSPSYVLLFSRLELWGATIGHFCNNYAYFIILSWLPLYLVKQQGYSIDAMAWIGGAVYVLAALFNIIGGRVSDRWIAKGGSVNRVRKTMVVAAGFIGCVCMFACALGGARTAVAGLLLYSLSAGLGSFGAFAAGQTLAGPGAAAKWMGVQNGVSGLSGVAGPMLTGALIDATGSYRAAFLISAALAVVGTCSWGVVIRKIQAIDWTA
jgi:MFS family permease